VPGVELLFFIDQHLYPRGCERRIFQSASHSPGLLRDGELREISFLI